MKIGFVYAFKPSFGKAPVFEKGGPIRDFEDLANSMSGTSLVFEFVGANIEDTYDQTFRITVPGAYFEPNQAQGVDGPSYLATDWAWSWKFDGTNTPTIEVINAETAI